MSDSTLPDRDTVVARARAMMDGANSTGALRLVEQFIMANPQPPPPPGLHMLRAQLYLKKNIDVVALHGFEAELFLDPDNIAAREQLNVLRARMYPAGTSDPAARPWQTALSPASIKNFEWTSQRYTYRGVPMVKNCFDLAIYPLLLAQVRPATIIEVGTLYGGSAAWFSDLTAAFALPTRIISIDLHGMPLLQPPRVTFLQGNGRALEKTLSVDFIAQLPRPLLVIEDADHQYETTLAVLKFFHPILRSGEYIVVEDGMSANGPIAALREFFASHGAEYEVDSNWCDYFGLNVTWCVNGFLRRR